MRDLSHNFEAPPTLLFEKTAGYLTRLHRITAALSEAVTAHQVAAAIVTEALPLFEAAAGGVFLLSEDEKEFVSLRVTGYAPDVLQAGKHFPVDISVPLTQAVHASTIIVIEHLEPDDGSFPILEGLTSGTPGALAAIPILRLGRVIGVIGLVFSHPRQVSESERNFMLLLGEQCGAALARAGEYDQQQHAYYQTQMESRERQQLLDALLKSEERLRLVLTATHDGVWDWQPHSGEVFLSTRWKEMLGWPEEEVINAFESWTERVHPDDLERVQGELQAHLEGKTGHYVSEHRMRHRDGTYRWMLSRGLALRDQDGQVTRVVGTVTDTTDRKRSEEELSQVIHNLRKANERLVALATTDGLTGLKNERVFEEHLADEFRRARRYQEPLSLILLDVDHFKNYNDAFGHPSGSRVLKTLATLLEQTARETDVVCRYGGEEFVLILPHTSGSEALALAERLRTVVEAHPWKRRTITISLGVCTLNAEMTESLTLLERADAALYQAKADGRNRVVNGCAETAPQTLSLDLEL